MSTYGAQRREEVTLSRLRIGHTSLTYGHLMTSEPPPTCQTYSVTLTIKHIYY